MAQITESYISDDVLNALTSAYYSTKSYSKFTCHIAGGSYTLADWELDDWTGKPFKNPTQHIQDSLAKVIKNLTTSPIQRKLEREFQLKWGPRCIHHGPTYHRLSTDYSFTHDVELNTSQELELLGVAKTVGLGRSRAHHSVWDVFAPNMNASAGFCYDGKTLSYSSKGFRWSYYQKEAQVLMEKVLKDDFLDISRRYELEYLQEVCARYFAAYIMLSREDGGPHKGRPIFSGSALTYILETIGFGIHHGDYRTGINKDMHASQFIASTNRKIHDYKGAVEGEWLMSTDASKWDRTRVWHQIVSAIYILCLIYNVPPKLALFIIAVNVAAPVILSSKKLVKRFLKASRKQIAVSVARKGLPKYVLLWLIGVIRSGTGIFVKANHLLRLWSNWAINFYLCGLNDPGLAYGDDASLATEADVNDICELMRDRYNIISKPEAQIRSREGLAMLRRVFLHCNEGSVPIAWSVARNYFFSERPKHYSDYPYDWALSKRAQEWNIIYASQNSSQAWLDFRDKLRSHFDRHLFYDEWDDKKLMSLCSKSAISDFYYTILRART